MPTATSADAHDAEAVGFNALILSPCILPDLLYGGLIGLTKYDFRQCCTSGGKELEYAANFAGCPPGCADMARVRTSASMPRSISAPIIAALLIASAQQSPGRR